MDRKVTVVLTVKLMMRIDEGVEVQKVVDELEYSFSDTTGSAQVEDTEIVDNNITDSR